MSSTSSVWSKSKARTTVVVDAPHSARATTGRHATRMSRAWRTFMRAQLNPGASLGVHPEIEAVPAQAKHARAGVELVKRECGGAPRRGIAGEHEIRPPS